MSRFARGAGRLAAGGAGSIVIIVQAQVSAAVREIKTLTSEFRTLRRDIKSTDNQIAPLTRSVAGLTAAFASAGAVTKAIKLARNQIDQQVKLQVALGENIHLFEQQLEAAAEFQKATLFTDEVTLSVQALALSFGVAIDELEDFVAAAATVATIGIVPNIEAAARQLLFFRSGKGQPLSALARLPLAKNLTEAERAAGGVEKAINRLLGDVAREVARTPFGILQQDINLIGDEFERLGRVLILVVGPALSQAKQAFSGFVDTVEGIILPAIPLINAIIQPLSGILRELIKLSAALALFAVLAKTFRILTTFAKKFLIVLRIIINPFGAIIALIGASIVAAGIVIAKVETLRTAFGGLLVLLGASFNAIRDLLKGAAEPLALVIKEWLENISKFVDESIEAQTTFGKIVERLIEINKGIKDGSITFEEVVQDARIALVRLFVFIKGTIINPIFKLVKIGIGAIKLGFLAIAKVVKITAEGIFLAFVSVFEGLVRAVTKFIDFASNRLADLLEIFNKDFAQQFRLTLDDSDFVKGIDKLRKTTLADIAETSDEIEGHVADELERREEINKEADEAEVKLRRFLRLEVARDKREKDRFDRDRKIPEPVPGIEPDSRRIRLLREARVDAERLGNAQIIAAALGRVQRVVDIETVGVERIITLMRKLGVTRVELTEDEVNAIKEKQLDLFKTVTRSELSELKTAFKQRTIDIKDFAKRRRELAVRTIDFERGLEQAKFDANLSSIEREQKARATAARKTGEQKTLESELEALKIIEEVTADVLRFEGIVAQEREKNARDLARIKKEKGDEELIIINKITRFQEEGAINQAELTKKEFERRQALAEAESDILQKRDEALREQVRQTRTLLDLDERRLRSQREFLQADLLAAANAIQRSFDATRESLRREPTGDERETFAREADLAREAAVTTELNRILDELGDQNDILTSAILRRNQAVELGNLQQQVALDLNARDLKLLIAQTQATIANVTALQQQINASEQFRQKQELLIQVNQEFALTLAQLILDLQEYNLLLLELEGTFGEGLVSALRAFINEQDNAFKQAVKLANVTIEAFGTNLTQAFVDVITSAKSAKEAFLAFAKNTLTAILQAINKMLILKALALALGLLLSGPGAAAGAAGGSGGGDFGRTRGFFGFTRGGLIPKKQRVFPTGLNKGGTVEQDQVVVLRKKTKKVPEFNKGGTVERDQVVVLLKDSKRIKEFNEGGTVERDHIKTFRGDEIRSLEKDHVVIFLERLNEGGSVKGIVELPDESSIERLRKRRRKQRALPEFNLGGTIGRDPLDEEIEERYSGGGLLPGRGPDRDTVVIGATPGEYMLRRRAADYYGASILNAMNQRAIPREMMTSFGRGVGETKGTSFQTGGEVGRQSQSAMQILPVLVADGEAIDNLLKGGRNEMLDWLRENKDQFIGDDVQRTG